MRNARDYENAKHPYECYVLVGVKPTEHEGLRTPVQVPSHGLWALRVFYTAPLPALCVEAFSAYHFQAT